MKAKFVEIFNALPGYIFGEAEQHVSEPGTLRYSFTSISTCFLLMPPSQQWY